MTEHEMLQEIERLRHELADATKSREQLREMLCAVLPVDRTEITAEEFEQIVKHAKPVDDLLREILPPEMHYALHDE